MSLDKLNVVLMLVNFFVLALALLALHFNSYRLRLELESMKRMNHATDRYQHLFNASSDGIIRCDGRGRIIMLNDAGLKILGIKDLDNQSKSQRSAMEWVTDPRERYRFLKSMLKDNRVTRMEMRITKADHDRFIAITAHTLADDKGIIDGFEGIFQDVTDRIQLQDELTRYNQTLQVMVENKSKALLDMEREKFKLERMAVIGQTTTAIVHEVRNPLATIKVGVTALLSRSVFSEPDRKCLEVIAQATDRLDRILKDLLNISKPLVLNRSPQDLHVILNLVLKQMTNDFESNKIRLHREYMKDSAQCFIDPDRLIQVFTNLFFNAINSMPEGGIILVKTKPLDDGRIYIGISDTGMGIKTEDKAHLFEPFFTTKNSGTGLGLTLAKNIVEGHQGTIRVNSIWGEGTRIEIELPRESDSNAINGYVYPHTLNHGNHHVMDR